MAVRVLAALMFLASLSGARFAATSTSDFARHLDRQVHDIHCSFIPGAPEPDAGASTEACRATMMSPYSSVMRTDYWGGIPVSLPGFGTFAFLALWSVFLFSFAPAAARTTGLWTAFWWLIPAATSAYMGRLALVELDAPCKLCIGIYASSAAGLLFALVAVAVTWRGPRRQPVAVDPDDPDHVPAPVAHTPPGWWSLPAAAACVALPIAAYVASIPDASSFADGCGELASPDDGYGVMISLSEGPVDAIEVLDPLCAACRGFEERLAASTLGPELGRRGLLFPLDAKCNWMVSSSMHPGACSVSEAILCAPDNAREILAWSFANQDAIMDAERAREGAAAEMVGAQFPAVQACVGSPDARSALHRGLRWAVQNEIPVLTPQLFVEGTKLCNEDTDLGLEFVLSRMIANAKGAP